MRTKSKRYSAPGVLLGFVLLVAAVLTALYLYSHRPYRGLPYQDSFAKGSSDDWEAFGGTWELANGMMRNDSDERGAKLLAGSRFWKDYSVEADVYLLGNSGDAGLIIRSGNEEEGVNAYSGYYAGVRTSDNSLVFGRAEHSWMEISKANPFPEALRSFTWYHLKLVAVDCKIGTELSSFSPVRSASVAVTDSACIRTGRIGLRSYSSGGIWRNIVVREASERDLDNLVKISRDDSRARTTGPLQWNHEFLGWRRSFREEQARSRPNVGTQTIASLQFTSSAKPTIATVRGVVILSTPRLYVQDATGGVYVPQPQTPLLKVGDEVEVTGQVHSGDFSARLENATVQQLWARTPAPPVSVTVSQAATGSYDATFIEVSGRLTHKEHGADDTLILDLEEGPQSFRAVMNPWRSDLLFNQLKVNSKLRLRGICTVDPDLTHNLTSFVLLLRSTSDVEVASGPPWWTLGHIIAITAVLVILALVSVSLYHRVENWRLRGILEERERLAHEIHDTLAQSFAGIGFQLQAIRNNLTCEMTTVSEQLDVASNLVRHSHEEARRSIATLRSEDLETSDLLSALVQCADRMVQGGGVRVISDVEGDPRSIPLRIADTLFRIGQEAIANAVRHAHPTTLIIRLTYCEGLVHLTIEDNGVSFTVGNNMQGFGIRGMRRRAQSIAAVFEILSSPGNGSQVKVHAPLPPRASFLVWPGPFRKYKETSINGRATTNRNSNSHRG